MRKRNLDDGAKAPALQTGVPIDYHTMLGEAALELAARIPSVSVQLSPRIKPPGAIVSNGKFVADIQIVGKKILARISGLPKQVLSREWVVSRDGSINQMIDYLAKYLS